LGAVVVAAPPQAPLSRIELEALVARCVQS
jgi:hypothetical protein